MYSQLAQTNQEYDARTWRTIRGLYTGGFALAASAKSYLPKLVNETDERYKERLAHAVYSNHFATIIDNGVAELFREKLTVQSPESVDSFWGAFGGNADLCGQSFSSVVQKALLDALLCGRSFVGIDFPAVDEPTQSLAHEDAVGAARAYCFGVAPESVIDWEYAPTGRAGFAWCVTHKEVADRSKPGAQAAPVEEFTVWAMTADGYASWARYRPDMVDGKSAGADAEFRKVGEGVTSFRSIPIVELRLPDGMCLGAKLGPLALDIFQRSSALKSAVNRSLFALPVVKLGPEIGAVGGAQPSEAQNNPNRAQSPQSAFQNKGYMVLGSEDSVAYLEPSAAPFELADRQLKDLVDDMYRVANQTGRTLAMTSRGVGRSGVSKLTDKEATSVWLSALSDIVKPFAVRVYAAIAAARGETVEWSASGLDDYDTDDRETLIKELQVASTIDLGSPTFSAHWRAKLAFAIAENVSDDERVSIQTEIKENEIRRQTGRIDTSRIRSGGER